jgi:hypothetical protein
MRVRVRESAADLCCPVAARTAQRARLPVVPCGGAHRCAVLPQSDAYLPIQLPHEASHSTRAAARS